MPKKQKMRKQILEIVIQHPEVLEEGQVCDVEVKLNFKPSLPKTNDGSPAYLICLAALEGVSVYFEKNKNQKKGTAN